MNIDEVYKNQNSIKIWFQHLEEHKNVPKKYRHFIFELALKKNPGNYKLWHAYLKERKAENSDYRIANVESRALISMFERSLVFLNKMPRIWLEYLDFLFKLKLITASRRVFNRALQALPITQQNRIWPPYLKFLRCPGIPVETICSVYERYLHYSPKDITNYITLLKKMRSWDQVSGRLLTIINKYDYLRPTKERNNYHLWMELCDLITKRTCPDLNIQVESMIRYVIKAFVVEVSQLWIYLADYYTRRGLFQMARDIYEDGISSAITILDFTSIFNAYVHFEESVLIAKIESKKTNHSADKTGFLIEDNNFELDQQVARFEFLIERRTKMLSSVFLRQNPNNVLEWYKRINIFANNPIKQIVTYSEAICKIEPSRTTGKPHMLWISLSRMYEYNKEFLNSRIVFNQALSQKFSKLDYTTQIYCEWLEMELRLNNYKTVIETLYSLLEIPAIVIEKYNSFKKKLTPKRHMFNNLKLLNLLSDLEESYGTDESTKAVFYRIISLRVCKPETIINFGLFLRENNYMEEAFHVYERGVDLFRFPHSKDIWHTYLEQYTASFRSKGVEKIRNLYDRVIKKACSEHCKLFYLKYAEFEERYGTLKRALHIYKMAARAVPMEQRKAINELHARKAREFFSAAKVREVYETAIDAEEPYHMKDDDIKDFCLSFALFEKEMGEIDRARAIFLFGSKFTNPNIDKNFWKEWDQFEVQHGNLETFKDMLVAMRSIKS
eukprot:gnl/TRDRNA2_/TRDRNA2_177822_c0_seq1.p1 gnl/TRDRNA2_/TRDRNA2_177822_c0~~gnl/TRDRNA2_/TRDRNA2_177822_c0_seq1.p1  ORF type:complete len:728 (-),score=-27.74 gnl/TRDRNA2_/TRDRNA2_177822_c0_seq1:101-2284(-)